jgi:hypothetical protein
MIQGKYVVLVTGSEKQCLMLLSVRQDCIAMTYVISGWSEVYRCQVDVYEVEAAVWPYFRALAVQCGCVVLSSLWHQ